MNSPYEQTSPSILAGEKHPLSPISPPSTKSKIHKPTMEERLPHDAFQFNQQFSPLSSPKLFHPIRLFSFSPKKTLASNGSTHQIQWSAASETGYKAVPHTDSKEPLHEQCEDHSFPSVPLSSRTALARYSESSETASGARLFILADGHGGHKAPIYMIKEMKDRMMQLLDSQSWDFGKQQHQFRLCVERIFQEIDQAYCDKKKNEYRYWVRNGRKQDLKPEDDGCTMVVNIIAGNWFINCNVGDSRTVLGCKQRADVEDTFGMDEDEEPLEWMPLFASNDHSMCHVHKVWEIHQAGGQFINPNGTVRPVRVEHPDQRTKPYSELNGARVFRTYSSNLETLGVSHRRALNLTATMGDVLFKLAPAILSAIPDVTFYPLDEDKEYVLVSGTDGVWDHLRLQLFQESQNELLIRHVGRLMETVFEQEEIRQKNALTRQDTVSDLREADTLEMQLHLVARSLVEREKHHEESKTPLDLALRSAPRLFFQNQIRYDDATAFVISLRPSA